MRKSIPYILILIPVFIALVSNAQQLPISNQYLVNRYIIAPSYAGADGNTQIYIGLRNDWSNVEHKPRTSYISAYMPANEKVWLGAQIISDNSGIFNNIYGQFSYTYHLTLGYERMIYFGLWGSFFQNKINLNDISVADPNDPLLLDQDELKGFSLNAGTSIVLRWHDLHLGVSIPYLFKNRDVNSLTDAMNIVELSTQLISHISYKFMFSYSIDLEPMLVYRWIDKYDSQIEFSLRAIYLEDYWLGATYRDIGKTGISIGGRLTDLLTLNYTFEFVTKSYLAQPSSTHEFTLGFTLANIEDQKSKNKRRNYYNRRGR